MKLAPTILDDAGTPHPPFDPTRPALSGETEDPDVAAIRMRLLGSMQSRVFGSASLRVAGIVFRAGLVIGFLIANARYRWNVPLTPVLLVWIILNYAWGRFSRSRRAQTRFGDRVKRTLLGEGRCGCCSYKITDIAPGENNLVTCPECGASWKSESIFAPPPRFVVEITPKGVTLKHNFGFAIDKTGRVHPLYRPQAGGVHAELHAQLQRATRTRRIVGLIALCTLEVLLLAWVGWGLWRPIRSIPWIDIAISCIVLANAVIVVPRWGMRIWRGQSAISSSRSVHIFVRNRICPGCGEPLGPGADQPTPPTGPMAATTCSHCGGIW